MELEALDESASTLGRSEQKCIRKRVWPKPRVILRGATELLNQALVGGSKMR